MLTVRLPEPEVPRGVDDATRVILCNVAAVIGGSWFVDGAATPAWTVRAEDGGTDVSMSVDLPEESAVTLAEMLQIERVHEARVVSVGVAAAPGAHERLRLTVRVLRSDARIESRGEVKVCFYRAAKRLRSE